MIALVPPPVAVLARTVSSFARTCKKQTKRIRRRCPVAPLVCNLGTDVAVRRSARSRSCRSEAESRRSSASWRCVSPPPWARRHTRGLFLVAQRFRCLSKGPALPTKLRRRSLAHSLARLRVLRAFVNHMFNFEIVFRGQHAPEEAAAGCLKYARNKRSVWQCGEIVHPASHTVLRSHRRGPKRVGCVCSARSCASRQHLYANYDRIRIGLQNAWRFDLPRCSNHRRWSVTVGHTTRH